MLQIDNKTIEPLVGETLIEVAGRAGIVIPRLCYVKGAVHKSSCMVCVVKDLRNGQIIPSCSTIPADGMQIDSSGEDLLALRRSSLELLLSDHRADCEAPCSIACPGSMDIAEMNRLVEAGKDTEALRLLRDTLVIPATLCYICNAPCEKICRRGQIDKAVEVREIKKRLVNGEKEILLPEKAPSKGKTIAIDNSSPAGLAIAYELMCRGYDVTVVESKGEFLTPYIDKEKAPDEIIQYELKALELSGLQLSHLNENPTQLCDRFDVVINVVQGEITAIPICGEGEKFTFASKIKQPARQVEEGRAFAARIDNILAMKSVDELSSVKLFNSTFPKLTEEEIAEYRKSSLTGHFTRCLYCDCNSKTNCRLRDAATAYNCKGNTYNRKSSRIVSRRQVNGAISHEPAKCISCGLCVYNSVNGFAFSGRGFEMQVIIPQGNEKNIGIEMTELCPTGAIGRIRN